jgi:hypothetical protein
MEAGAQRQSAERAEVTGEHLEYGAQEEVESAMTRDETNKRPKGNDTQATPAGTSSSTPVSPTIEMVDGETTIEAVAVHSWQGVRDSLPRAETCPKSVSGGVWHDSPPPYWSVEAVRQRTEARGAGNMIGRESEWHCEGVSSCDGEPRDHPSRKRPAEMTAQQIAPDGNREDGGGRPNENEPSLLRSLEQNLDQQEPPKEEESQYQQQQQSDSEVNRPRLWGNLRESLTEASAWQRGKGKGLGKKGGKEGSKDKQFNDDGRWVKTPRCLGCKFDDDSGHETPCRLRWLKFREWTNQHPRSREENELHNRAEAALSSIEAPTGGDAPQPEKEPAMGSMDLSSLGFDSVCKYREIWQGEERLKVNYDSGAATTAFPVELAGNLAMEKVGHFIVASGADIPNYGRVQVTVVHKPLGSAGEFSKSHDAMLWEAGGVLLPKNGPIAVGLAKECQRLCDTHGLGDALHLYKEGGFYNFYLKKMTGPVQINSADTPGSLSGNSRPVGTPP